MTKRTFLDGIRLPAQSLGNRKTQVGSSHHLTGRLVIGEGPGRRLGFESHLEAKAAMILAARRETLSLVEQFRINWTDEFGKVLRHFVDFVQDKVDGQRIGYAVRPTARVSQKYLLKLARIKEQALASAILSDFRLFTETEVCPVELSNASQFHAVRRPDPFGDTVAAEVVRNMSGVTTIGHLTDAIGLDGMGFRAVVRLIRSGELEMVRHEVISRRSQVFKVKEL